MKSHKLIETKEIKFWRRAKLATWFIPVLFLLWHMPTYLASISEGIERNGLMVSILMIVIGSIFNAFIPMLIWWLISSQMLKGAIKRARVTVVHDIDYYRDKLDGFSPTLISLLMDLRIETEKDLAATLLRLEMNGVVQLEEDEVTVLIKNLSILNNGDFALVEILKDKGILHSKDLKVRLRPWENAAISDALASPYFKPQEELRMKAFLPGCVTPIISCIILYVTIFSKTVQHGFDVLDVITTSGMTETEAIQVLSNDPQAVLAIVLMFIDLALFFIVFLSPILFFIYVVVKSTAANNRLKRSELGNEAMDCIYGLKNFIHDFSNLAEVTKEQVVLWDDFLVYAVVLEENELVLKEILQRRDINTDILKWRRNK